MYARCRAQGATMAKSAEEAGIAMATAQKLEHHEDVKARVRELRESSQEFTGVTLAAIIGKLWKNAEEASATGDFKASNQALSQLTQLVKEDGGKVAGRLRGMGGNGSPPKALRAELRDQLGPRLITAEAEPVATEDSEGSDG